MSSYKESGLEHALAWKNYNLATDIPKIYIFLLTTPNFVLKFNLMEIWGNWRKRRPAQILSYFLSRKRGQRSQLANSLGRHVLAEIYGCSFDILNDREKVEMLMVNAALEAGAEVREVVFHKFSPQGVSGVVVISESHLAIHTWPELGYAAVDVFTCGDRVNPWDACNYLTDHFKAGHMTATEIKRGIVEDPKEAVNI
ncbi:S-adenosylmethionine decarboxylase proenzyme (modular protein) [Candidatus Desulfosporosinus infrequens]|uniref:S-adenosylmethionine decarboxylase proenzyme n=1 Tax=Candidatus Desulfosporosinus infrequens TaxID=2043169 RepID=A0A2U3LUM9_9FIRM|nr:S-adenosylmethionine decarboxylase proenzyme (modular protein) [Candidatus Desulfosporosinus infrequens]